ncbi:MAG: hypothetical protein CK431_26935 [Mycobacterium sp.]|nr:MAG: hypothetical protein CK431_26935 [Mycobacterium sp.]
MPPYRTSTLVLCCLGALATASCGAPDRAVELPPTAPPFRRVDIIPVTATMLPGDTLRFRVVATPAVVPDVWSWTSSDTTTMRVDGAGLARSLARSTGVAVCAAAVIDPGIKGCATIVVPAAP